MFYVIFERDGHRRKDIMDGKFENEYLQLETDLDQSQLEQNDVETTFVVKPNYHELSGGMKHIADLRPLALLRATYSCPCG